MPFVSNVIFDLGKGPVLGEDSCYVQGRGQVDCYTGHHYE